MAFTTKKIRERRKNLNGDYDIIHRETEGSLVALTDGTTAQDHVSSGFLTAEGIHGMRYASDKKSFQLHNSDTNEWDEVSAGSGDAVDIIHQQTLVQMVSNASVDWVFKSSKNLGAVLSGAFRLDSTVLTPLMTLAAVATSETAMSIIAAYEAAMAAVTASETAMATVTASETAMSALTVSEISMTTIAASETAMVAVAASETAMAAIAASETAMAAIAASETAMEVIAASEIAMAVVVTSETAMAVVATSETAMTVVAASEIAMAAVVTSETAMTAVAASETAMIAVAASETAMAAVAASEIAMAAVAASETAMTALTNSSFVVRYAPVNTDAWRNDTLTFKGILLYVASGATNSNTYNIDETGTVGFGTMTSIFKTVNSSVTVYWVCYSAISNHGVYYIPFEEA